jgi:hypothetical protein
LIPRIIHYVWLGPKPLDPISEKCLSSWRHFLPEWEIRCWNEKNSPMDHPFVRKMMERGYYGFASDYIRLEALETMGGLYLDTDMEFLLSPESLLNASCITAFLSRQNRISKNSVALGVVGAVPGHPWIRELRGAYGAATQAVMNTTLATDSLRRRGLSDLRDTPPDADFVQVSDVRIYHCDYFYPQKEAGEFLIRQRTTAVHHGLAQWGGPEDPFPWWKKLYDLRLDRKILRPIEAWIRKLRSHP